jgi:hypothetical protein
VDLEDLHIFIIRFAEVWGVVEVQPRPEQEAEEKPGAVVHMDLRAVLEQVPALQRRQEAQHPVKHLVLHRFMLRAEAVQEAV